MYEHLSQYDDIINDLLNKIFYMPTEELKFFLKKVNKNLDEIAVNDIIFSAQRRGIIVLSEDGWVISKKGYRRYVPRDEYDEDNVLNGENALYRMKKLSPLITSYEVFPKNIFSSLWVALDMFPASRNFMLGTAPWDIVFDIPESENHPCQLYQITTIPKEMEDARCLLLSQMEENLHDNDKEIITRIAVVGDKESVWKVPKIGFKYIVEIDHSKLHHYEVLEKREDKDAWK